MAAQPTLSAAETAREEQLRIEARLRVIMAIPYEVCPWPFVRNAMFARILSGAPIDAYAYASASRWVGEDNTYDTPWRGSPRAWAIRNGYAVDDGSEPTPDSTDGKEAR